MPTPLYDLPEIEYLDGHPYPKVSPKFTHALVQGALLRVLGQLAEGRGVVVPELRLDPGAIDGSNTEFVPDVAYLSYERLRALSGEAREKPPFSPDIAAEVRSPSDSLGYLAQKVARYLATGSILVLDIDPAKRRITAHALDDVRTFESGEMFAHPAAPWLTFEVNALFVEIDAL